MSSFEVNYEEDLIDRIKDLIDGYDKDSILKEYLQNADDSGATELIVTFDKQDYSQLNNTKFEYANSSSLLLYNNSEFKEKDFKSIVKISAKGKADDANSTGRFGQGFSSSFSISDHPSFVSNKRAYWFDVQRNAVSQNEDKSIQGWDYTTNNSIETKAWLNTFHIAGFSHAFGGTIFRLPLRNENTSRESLISNEIFTFDDFLKWIQEWKDNSENLLFLRHIHRLVLQEVDEDGKKSIHLEINTKNKDEIENINNQIQKEFEEKTLLKICEEWESNNKELPFFSYKHEFEIKYLDIENNQYINKNKFFTVTNGLVRGVNNNLIKSAKKALEIEKNPRKVLPWVGVAIEVDDNNKPITNKNKLFTFLPLPINSNYPVHIHGWFDLDSKRTEITRVGSGYDKETLVEWNRLLIEEGVAKAWALLIDSLKIDKNSHYDFWAKDTEFSLNKELIKGFYQHISKLKCLYISHKNEERWESPKNELYYIDEDNDVLFEALQHHFPMIINKPPQFIINNFKKVDLELKKITPEFLRTYLKEESQNIKFPIALDQIPITMLQKKGWFIEVLKYCANKGEDYSVIDELPFGLTLDGKIYNAGSNMLFEESPSLSLFQDIKSLFIDREIVKSIGYVDTLPSTWLLPTLQNKLQILKDNWEKITLNKKWIFELVQNIAKSEKDELNKALSLIQNLAIVYQQNEEFTTLGGASLPILIRDEDKNNIKYFTTIKMDIIHVEYIDIYKPLLIWTYPKEKQKVFVNEISSKVLAEHLAKLDSYNFFENKDVRDFIIDILTEDISWFDALDDTQKTKLDTMPFIETVVGNIYPKNTDTNLFLPTDFTPPKDIENLTGKYEIIAVEKNSNLYELYKKMGLKEQDINNYIKEIVIPFLENSDSSKDKKEVLKWLALEWNDLRDNINDKTLESLKNSKMIPSLKEGSDKASELYIPTIELHKLFQDNLYMPISFEEDTIQEKWIELLIDLGVSKDLFPKHIIIKIEDIIEDTNIELAIDLLNFIANKFEIFEEMKFENISILDKLKEYAWLPVEEANDILKPTSEFTSLKKANELILFDDLKIAGGYYHILNKRVNLGKKDERGEYSTRDMAKRLGIVIKIPEESIFESFRRLMELPPHNGQVVNYAKAVYEYIGKNFKSKRVDFGIEEKTILIDNQWIAPKYVYQYKINLTGIKSWESLVGNSIESNLAKGLISLGVQDKPTFEFFIEQLQELPQEQALNQNQLKDAKALLHEIQNEAKDLVGDVLPLLTGYDQLLLSSNLYINDFPAYKNAKEKNKDLYFCQNQFERLAKKLNVLSLNENHTSKIYQFQETETTNKIIDILERDSFKEGLLRLLYHEKKIKEDEISDSVLDEILPSKITFVDKLVIEYFIEDNFLFRSDETTYEDNGELYILEQDDEDDMIELIAKYICDNKNLKRDSFAWLERILRNKMNREEIHDFLDKKKVAELPQKLDIDDEPSLFEENDNLSASNNETVYDTSTTQEEKYIDRDNVVSKVSKDFDNKKKSFITHFDESKKTISSNKKNQDKVEKESSNSYNRPFIASSNDIKPVSVVMGTEISEDEQSNRNAIGDKGENYVVASKDLLSNRDNYFEKAPQYNKGFDIYEKDQNGNVVRYIEVKSLAEAWEKQSVSITDNQLEFAREKEDQWWLFVVENINGNNTKVYQLQNPISQMNRFAFDSSWKNLAVQDTKIEKDKSQKEESQ